MFFKRTSRLKSLRLSMLEGGSALVALGSAVFPLAAVQAQEATAGTAAGQAGEIVVTASRRSETVAKLPFNISAYGADQLAKGNITSVTALTQQVPNFTIQNGGARSAASSIPIIRGLNASPQTSLAARYFQSPVGFYLDNAPITGGLPLFDIQRVEVLRGPQGTLYGAGALSGAVRIVPAKAKVGETSGFITGSAGLVAHSGDQNYSIGGALNLPLGTNLALRVSARHEYEAGFIDQHDIFKRENNDYVFGAPVLANSADPAYSSGVLFDKKDANFARTTSGRASLVWEPTDGTTAELSYNYAKVEGNGGPVDNRYFDGGAFPIDPRLSVKATGEYERSLPMLEPFERDTHLAALDISHDLGFATLSTTVALGYTKGATAADSTVALLGVPYGYYYTGSPANPRTVIPVLNKDKERNWSEEIRLVSNGDGPISFIGGVFLQQSTKDIGLSIYAPGASAQSLAAFGSTLPIAAGGTYIVTKADGEAYSQITRQVFRDYSAYGEVSWKPTDKLKITGGARVFHQTFSQDLQGTSQFFFFSLDEQSQSKVTSQIFKASAAYQFTDRFQTYFTWSQGFRRGGANAFALTGAVREPRELLTYKPDKTDNFELGVKGTLGSIFVSADVFYVKWKNPQIDLLTPFILTNAVVNGNTAVSKGFELESSGPIGDTGLSFNLGLAYAKARLDSNFDLPAGDGIGGIIAGAIIGRKGDRLPGAPDWTGSFTLNYMRELASNQKLDLSVGVDYRDKILNNLETVLPGTAPARQAQDFALLRANVTYTIDNWSFEVFGTNLTDKHVIIARARRSLSSFATLGDWGEGDIVGRPREIGLRVTRNF